VLFIIDPIFRFALLTLSPISFCCCRRQWKLQSRAEKRFIQELNVKNMLPRIRNCEAIVNGLVQKDYVAAMKYNKAFVISPDHPTDSSGDDLSSEGENYSTNQKVKLAIVKALKIDNNLKTQLKNNIKKNNMNEFWMTIAGRDVDIDLGSGKQAVANNMNASMDPLLADDKKGKASSPSHLSNG